MSIKFENPDVLFGYLSSQISPQFQSILSEFVPLYLGIINKPEYADKIKEVRIEGHTGAWDDYIFTIKLSQERSNSVLAYILSSSYFADLRREDQEKVKFWLTANGLGNGRMLDSGGNFTYHSKNGISANSRRVEFRVVTTSEELIDKISQSF